MFGTAEVKGRAQQKAAWGWRLWRYCVSGLYPISSGNSLQKSKHGVTSESYFRVILVIVQVIGLEKQREKKGWNLGAGRQVTGHYSNPNEKMWRAQFRARNSSY